MNITIAQEIHNRVGRIASVATFFYARYGSNYRMTDDSPKSAWDLYNQIMAEQMEIAKLLDNSALVNPYIRWEKWWEQRDVMNIGLVNELDTEALRLIERISYLDALGKFTEGEQTVQSIQEALAGLLHPIARQNVVQSMPLAEAV